MTVTHWDASNQSQPPVAGILTAFQGMAASLPSGVQVAIPGSGDIIEDTTGALVGVWSSTGAGVAAGSGPANCVAGAGACISWTTGGIVNGKKGPRKLRGRTFVVPLHYQCYDSDGTLYSTALSSMQTFANALNAAGPLAIWHRPTSLGAADGGSYAVLTNKVRDKVAFLSSRRD